MKKRLHSFILLFVMILGIVASLNFITVCAVEDDDPKISFDANGGTGYMEPVYMNGNFPLPECTFTPPEGYRFKCWYRQGDPRELQVGDTVYVSSSNTVVSAIWEPIPAKVIFDSGNGTGTMEEIEIFGEYILPQCDYIAPDGMEFQCWQLDNQELQVGDTIYVDDIITVTALWKELPAEEPSETDPIPTDSPTVNNTGNNPEQNSTDNHLYGIIIIAALAALLCIVCIGLVVVVIILIKKKKS